MNQLSFQRMLSVGRKELLHIIRDPQTLMFTLLIPVCELFMLGYAIDTNVRHIRTIVADFAGTQESRTIVRRFENSQDFRIVGRAFSQDEVHQAIVAGRARVGIVIPEDYSRQLEAGQSAQILVLVDGTESSIAAEAVNVSNSLTLSESIERTLGGKPLPVEARPRVLFNPDTRSANFFIPGLMVVMCQMMATMLSANAIVREKENGTFEQLSMTPVGRLELLVGKILPYVVLTMAEFCLIAFLMWLVFQVPIHGSFWVLLAITFPFVLTMLAVGLLISTRASTTDAAGQMSMGTILPSVFLSGYVFPLDSMPWVFGLASRLVPATWLIDAARGVILRGAGLRELWVHLLVLWFMAGVLLLVSSRKADVVAASR